MFTDNEILTYWIDEFEEEFPDLPLSVLRIEYEDAIGTASNEKFWALGASNRNDADMHYHNAELNLLYSDWLNHKAIVLYGEDLR